MVVAAACPSGNRGRRDACCVGVQVKVSQSVLLLQPRRLLPRSRPSTSSKGATFHTRNDRPTDIDTSVYARILLGETPARQPPLLHPPPSKSLPASMFFCIKLISAKYLIIVCPRLNPDFFFIFMRFSFFCCFTVLFLLFY